MSTQWRAPIQSKTLNLHQPFFPCPLRFSCVALLTTMASQNEDIKAIIEIMKGMQTPAAKLTFYDFLCILSAHLTSSESETGVVKPDTFRITARGFTFDIGFRKKPQKHDSKTFIRVLSLNDRQQEPDPVVELAKFLYPMSGNQMRRGGVAPWGFLDETLGWRFQE
ncbi:hypothetical protein B0H11DRAFT_1948406, partial [Mycena galericulata]